MEWVGRSGACRTHICFRGSASIPDCVWCAADLVSARKPDRSFSASDPGIDFAVSALHPDCGVDGGAGQGQRPRAFLAIDSMELAGVGVEVARARRSALDGARGAAIDFANAEGHAV